MRSISYNRVLRIHQGRYSRYKPEQNLFPIYAHLRLYLNHVRGNPLCGEIIRHRNLLDTSSNSPCPPTFALILDQRIHPSVLGPSRLHFQRTRHYMTSRLVVQNLPSFSLDSSLLGLVCSSNNVKPAVRPMHPMVTRGHNVRIPFTSSISQRPPALDLVESTNHSIDARIPPGVVEAGPNIVKSKDIKQRQKSPPTSKFFSLSKRSQKQPRFILCSPNRGDQGPHGVIVYIA